MDKEYWNDSEIISNQYICDSYERISDENDQDTAVICSA